VAKEESKDLDSTNAEGFSPPMVCNKPFTLALVGEFTFEEGVDTVDQCSKYCLHKEGCKAFSIAKNLGNPGADDPVTRQCSMHGRQPADGECEKDDAKADGYVSSVHNRIEQKLGFCETGDSCASGLCLGWNCCEEAAKAEEGDFLQQRLHGHNRGCAVCALATGKCTLCEEKFELDDGHCSPLILRSYKNMLAADSEIKDAYQHSVPCGDKVDAVQFPLLLTGYSATGQSELGLSPPSAFFDVATGQAQQQPQQQPDQLHPQQQPDLLALRKQLAMGVQLAVAEASGVAYQEVNVDVTSEMSTGDEDEEGVGEDTVKVEVCIVVSDAAAANMLSSKLQLASFLPTLQTAVDDLGLLDLRHLSKDALSLGGGVEILYATSSGLQEMVVASSEGYTSDQETNIVLQARSRRRHPFIAMVVALAALAFVSSLVMHIARVSGFASRAGWHSPMQVAAVTEVSFELGDAAPSAADDDGDFI
jgi:hypothetical protein